MEETWPGGKYRPRRRKELPLEEQEDIVDAYRTSFLPQKEIARRHRVTPQLVSDLVSESKKKPEKMREKKQQMKEVAEQKAAVASAVKTPKTMTIKEMVVIH